MMPAAGGYEQRAAVAEAEEWTAKQAERLGVSFEDVMPAVKRGWTVWDVKRLSAANTNELPGPPLHVVNAIRKIKDAPILPLRLDRGTRRRLRR